MVYVGHHCYPTCQDFIRRLAFLHYAISDGGPFRRHMPFHELCANRGELCTRFFEIGRVLRIYGGPGVFFGDFCTILDNIYRQKSGEMEGWRWKMNGRAVLGRLI